MSRDRGVAQQQQVKPTKVSWLAFIPFDRADSPRSPLGDRVGKIINHMNHVTFYVGALQFLLALPPPEDTPEEVLRTEIITEARSPIDGKPLTAAQYAQLIAQLEGRQPPDPQVNPKLRELIFLLRLRHQMRQILPFVDF
ncbi:hypothetical protein [Microseira sp. BLCC-F43]|uniref:hypothetical protein n=1 Tax=Microseira sp. BLCC-F43 TaxID=3153602 RepID=UPI0035B88CEA